MVNSGEFSVRVSHTQQIDGASKSMGIYGKYIKLTINYDKNKIEIRQEGGNTFETQKYNKSRFGDYTTRELFDKFISEQTKLKNEPENSYKIVQFPWSDKEPESRIYGKQPYFLNNGSEIYISWSVPGISLDIGGEIWSNWTDNDKPKNVDYKTQVRLEERLEITGFDKSSIVKKVIIKSPGQEDLKILDNKLVKSDGSENQMEFSGDILDADILDIIIEYWNKQVPNYETTTEFGVTHKLSLSESNHKDLKFISPDEDFFEEEEEEIIIDEKEEISYDKIKINVVIPNDLQLRIKEDIKELKIYLGDIPTESELLGIDDFIFQDEIDNDLLSDEYKESDFIGEEEIDEPMPQFDEIQSEPTPSDTKTGAPLSGTKLLTQTKSGKYWLLSCDKGVAGHRLKNVIKDLENYLNSNGFSGTKLTSNGIMRDLESSAITSNPARAVGSKHGAGLAIDIKFNIPNYKWNGISDNSKLANNKKLNKVIYKWVKSQGDLRWGGEFGGKSGTKNEEGIIKGLGITEYHHFELKDNKISDYWKPHEEELSKLGFNYKELNTTKKLQKLYLKLLGK